MNKNKKSKSNKSMRGKVYETNVKCKNAAQSHIDVWPVFHKMYTSNKCHKEKNETETGKYKRKNLNFERFETARRFNTN